MGQLCLVSEFHDLYPEPVTGDRLIFLYHKNAFTGKNPSFTVIAEHPLRGDHAIHTILRFREAYAYIKQYY